MRNFVLTLTGIACFTAISCKRQQTNDLVNAYPSNSPALVSSIRDYNSAFSMAHGSDTVTLLRDGRGKLLAADFVGALSGIPFASTPLIGPYVVLWAGFAGSYAACSACATQVPQDTLLYIDDVIKVNNPTNNFNHIGHLHNQLFFDFANGEPLFSENHTLRPDINTYVQNGDYIDATPAQRQALHDQAVVAMSTADSLIGLNNDLPFYKEYIENNEVITDTEKEIYLGAINTVVEGNLTFEASVDYFAGVEGIIKADGVLTKAEKDRIYLNLAIMKYSYAFWLKQ